MRNLETLKNEKYISTIVQIEDGIAQSLEDNRDKLQIHFLQNGSRDIGYILSELSNAGYRYSYDSDGNLEIDLANK